MSEYLKNESYYSECYDRMTIEECERWENKEKVSIENPGTEEEIKKQKEIIVNNFAVAFGLRFVKGERYLQKEVTLRRWMERDRAKDEKLENAIEPKGIRCINCRSSAMTCISRDLMTDSKNEESVLFMFQCGRCGKKRAYWENGTEWNPRPNPCPKCRTEMNAERSREGNVIETVLSCPACSHKEADIMDFGVKKDAVDPDFETKRKKYCLSEEEGKEYASAKITMEQVSDFMKKWKEKEENKDLYDAIGNIKKLTVSELGKLLKPIVEKAGYSKLEFEKPDKQKDVILGFGLQDDKLDRNERESSHELKKIIEKTLEGTNWRLMSDGVNYRLGFLTGRLRGTEGEDNLKSMILDDEKLTEKD